MMQIVFAAIPAIIYFTAGLSVASDAMTISTLWAFTTLQPQIFRPLMSLLDVGAQWVTAMAGPRHPGGCTRTRFSGGEQPRLAITRTLLREPPILVLDGATSALDNTTEAHVQQALDEMAEDAEHQNEREQ